MKTNNWKHIGILVCALATASCINVYASNNLNEKFVGEMKCFAITGEEEAVPIEDGEEKSSSNHGSSQEGKSTEEKFVGRVKCFAITGEEEAVPIEDGEKKSSSNHGSSQEGKSTEEKFVGEMKRFAITREEEAVPEDNAMIPYTASSTMTYSWGLYPEYASVSGVKADAVSESKKGGSYCKIDSIYARASIILNDGTKIIKKETKENASSVKAHVYTKRYTMGVKCFKSGHKFVNTGYNTVTKHITKYVE